MMNKKHYGITLRLPAGIGLQLKIWRPKKRPKETAKKNMNGKRNIHKARAEHQVHIMNMYR